MCRYCCIACQQLSGRVQRLGVLLHLHVTAVALLHLLLLVVLLVPLVLVHVVHCHHRLGCWGRRRELLLQLPAVALCQAVTMCGKRLCCMTLKRVIWQA